MKLRDARTKRFEMRMTEEEYQLLQLTAEYVGKSPTEFTRLLLTGAFREMRDILENGDRNNEDKQTFCDSEL